ncbi:DUF262 domain-containing protein [Tsukamurella strandjordii]|uniref:DUF262 domain-containing protein n=1 Tax=Tsukamurella strandjordii TaxID=147577 RepID=A0AA90NDL5_9ACTN|nr:DUF262 domain-containing protein [Tsukamurella strandjordii]MDP0400381.1 DUF262 domain-containing protein [Tsukamurella strandjordii]
MTNTEALRTQIADRAKEIRTDGYAMSIGEVLSLYRDGDIEIHPEFQRIFRWNDDQKSRLIESILLGIPIPPIFVSQRSDGVWDVIDGVQRLSTIFQFVGVYENEIGMTDEPLVLTSGEYLTHLEGISYYAREGTTEDTFDEALRRNFKRSKLDFQIITKESDPNAKYDLFQRLNAGSILSPQEARNCLMVMISRPFYAEILELSQSESFRYCVPLSDRQEEEAYREELVLRFFSQTDFNGDDRELRSEYGEFLTNWVKRRASEGPDLDTATFTKTFSLLAEALGEDAFRRYASERDKHLGPFSISAYEFVTSGVAHNLEHWQSEDPGSLRQRIESIWTAPEFRSNSGTGVSPRRRVPRIINASRKYFAG